MLQDLGNGLRMVGAGAALVAASVLGIILGGLLVFAATSAILAGVPACAAWIGFQSLLAMREDP